MGSTAMGRRWAAILAGGEGARLRALTRQLTGDDRPKQFCPLIGDCSLLEATQRRIAPLIPASHVLYSLTEAHRPYFQSLEFLPPRQLLVQPANRGTAPPIALAIVAIAQQDLNATVCILPCDHHYRVETAFCRALDRAFLAAEKYPDYLILQGAQALYPEVEYGWMQLGNRHPGSFPGANPDLYELCAFVEKPLPDRAVELLRRGALWNTFVMVGKVRRFLATIDAALPGLVEALCNIRRNERGESVIPMAAYQSLPTWQFSDHVLACSMPNLLVQRISGVGWTDLGAPARLAAVLSPEAVPPHVTDRAINPMSAPNDTRLREIAHWSCWAPMAASAWQPRSSSE